MKKKEMKRRLTKKTIHEPGSGSEIGIISIHITERNDVNDDQGYESYVVKQESASPHLNFAVTDGQSVVATRYVNSSTDEAASLYFSTGTSFEAAIDGHPSDDCHGSRSKLLNIVWSSDYVIGKGLHYLPLAPPSSKAKSGPSKTCTL
ncbi:hypothetical protein KEM48_013250 [Puccinia striiformis f. sp. tritici PST-130]|nr:hypothetical protein KEM48_013250 [Puccinia striiformis f. sp. tritici PST-130]